LAGSGFIAAIPYLVLGILLWFVGYAADWFQERKILSTGQGLQQKLFHCIKKKFIAF
jgi:hypothetical protein